MGKYSNVTADSIITACDSALSGLESNNIDSTIQTLLLNLDSSAASVIATANTKVCSNATNSVSNLKTKINTLKSAMDLVKKYQAAEKTRDYWGADSRYYYWNNTSHWKKDGYGNLVYDDYGNKIWVSSGNWAVNQEAKQKHDQAEKDISYYEKQIDDMLA